MNYDVIFLHMTMRVAAAKTWTISTQTPKTSCVPLADPPSLDATAVTAAPATAFMRVQTCECLAHAAAAGI